MYHYKVTFWDDYNNKTTTECGIVGSGNYKKAIGKLTDYYGEEYIDTIEIYGIEDVMPSTDLISFLEKEEEK